MGLVDWVKSLFKEPTPIVPEKKAESAPVAVKPAPLKSSSFMEKREDLIDAMLARTKRYIDMPVRESKGMNRSTVIDGWNKRVGAPMGTPYCAASIWCLWKDTCDALGYKFPMKATAASQAFITSVPSKYLRPEGAPGYRGDSGVLQMVSDKGRGHMTILTEDMKVGSKEFKTLEFNTNSAGSRDGDGGYAKTRNTIDQSKLNAGKKFRGFSDIASWILDANGVKR